MHRLHFFRCFLLGLFQICNDFFQDCSTFLEQQEIESAIIAASSPRKIPSQAEEGEEEEGEEGIRQTLEPTMIPSSTTMTKPPAQSQSAAATAASLRKTPPLPAPKKGTGDVSFVNDWASNMVGFSNTMGHIPFGEDRQNVARQDILDSHGDKGRYTGVVLLSTGMPHGHGLMEYEDDRRTYVGEWRLGRYVTLGFEYDINC
jgi:hypothetical protein